MLTETQKDILRYAVTGKSAPERKAIGEDDELALQVIAEYVAQQTAPQPPFIAMRRDNLEAQIAQLDAEDAERAAIQDLISQLPQG